MSLIDFKSVAAAQPVAWKSTIVGEVGPARIKVLRMDAQAYEAEVHDYNEGLLVLDGRMMLEVGGETVVVEAGARSGSMKVAQEAHQLGRSLGAVPGPVTSATSVGPHRLLHSGEARLVAGSTDLEQMIRQPVGSRGSVAAVRSRPAPSASRDARSVVEM